MSIAFRDLAIKMGLMEKHVNKMLSRRMHQSNVKSCCPTFFIPHYIRSKDFIFTLCALVIPYYRPTQTVQYNSVTCNCIMRAG